MGSFSKAPVADRAPRTSPEKSQRNTHGAEQPQSLRDRLKHKGRHYLNKAPGLLHKQSAVARWSSISEMADLHIQSPPDNGQRLVLPCPPAHLDILTTMEKVGLHDIFHQQEPARSTILEPEATTNSMTWPDIADPSPRVQNHRRWLSGYRSGRKRVNSEPVIPLGSGDLTGVGSQYDITTRSIATLPTAAFYQIPTRRALRHIQCFETDKSDRTQTQDNNPARNRYSQPALPTTHIDILHEDAYCSPPLYDILDIDLTRRDSSATTQGYSSAAESVFSYTRPSSTISAASTWDLPIGRASSSPSRRRSPFRRTLSSSSSLNIGRDSSHSLRDQAIPPIPVLTAEMRKRLSLPQNEPTYHQIMSGAIPLPDPNVTRVANADVSLTVSDQVALTGWVAQQRRVNRSPLANQLQEDSPADAVEQIAVEDSIKPHLEDLEKELTTIEERLSETGLSNEDAGSIVRDSSDDHVERRHEFSLRNLSKGDLGCSIGTETTTDIRSTTVSNKEPGHTPATSIAERGEEEETETSEISESMSDVSHESNESLEEAFYATSLDPALFETVTTLKGRITTLVLQRVSEWMRTCAPGQTSGDAKSGPSHASSRNKTRGGDDKNGKKRGLDDDSDDEAVNGAGRGNGDDQDKRQKMESPSARVSPNLACPFVKEYPGEKWPRCQKGWPSVHRIKEHVYRTHKAPIHCKRCFIIVKTEKQLELHLRQAVACEVINPPREMPGIDAETKERLKSRRGIQNISEEEKWTHMYRILFPLAQDIPSPYCDLQILEAPMTAEERAQLRGFLRREMPPRMIRDINNSIMSEPTFNLEIPERRLFEVISSAVWNAFDDVLPSLPPQVAPPDPPTEHMRTPEIITGTLPEPAPDTSFPSEQQMSFSNSIQEASNTEEAAMEGPEVEPFDRAYVFDRMTDFDMSNPASLLDGEFRSEPHEFGNVINDLNYGFNFNFITQQD
ncbi:hypothetical protein FHETE_4739 [Fusarium heterosporum]|uniref:Uncharacterized protein n=1 Tax=Fusarium heterosporum TaxID=42747 RepID=A0A8H5THV9_FUSHE|nr:hypothetical protein FHETE_4739 [Fusarium heterosporum]